MLKLTVRGAKEVSRRLSKDLTRVMGDNFDGIAKIIQRDIRDKAPKKRGKYAKTIMVRRNGQFNFVIYDGWPGSLLRAGSPPHEIWPRKKKALWWPGLKHPVAMVNHPGFKARTHVEDGLNAAQGDITRATKNLGTKIVQELDR